MRFYTHELWKLRKGTSEIRVSTLLEILRNPRPFFEAAEQFYVSTLLEILLEARLEDIEFYRIIVRVSTLLEILRRNHKFRW